MKNRRRKYTVQPISSKGESKVITRPVQTPERNLPGHPIAVAIVIAGLLVVVLGVTLSNIEVTTASTASWNLFG
ncbi:hypothetical protein [Pontiella agarivorans]|uniref:Uncharacterized protein n=1 Tax=Pontiella agarivorans TaxID=3038953 RepID=A0ABU5MV65_9BACT|nr:hypothetical protein [Pontiella agarivorans]MDZ8118104.1 hypothetical protein [Pontiella agarivorans]